MGKQNIKTKLAGLVTAGMVIAMPNLLALKISTPSSFVNQVKNQVEERKEAREENRAELKLATTAGEKRIIKLENRGDKNNPKAKAVILTGKVTAVSGTTLTVNKDGTDYSVLTDGKTQFRRLFWGKSSLAEISVNDLVNVRGLWTDDTQTTIQAVLVRDLSIQKRAGTFFGTVKSVSGAGFVMTTAKRGDQTVTIDTSSQLVDRTMKAISLSDIKVGDKVRVKGLWDRTNSTITEVKQVKDFSIPAQGKLTPTATQSATP